LLLRGVLGSDAGQRGNKAGQRAGKRISQVIELRQAPIGEKGGRETRKRTGLKEKRTKTGGSKVRKGGTALNPSVKGDEGDCGERG